MSTLRDVAKQAGVSVATASRVLNGKESGIKVTLATRERILRACRALGYQPNPVARALRTKRTRLIGVIVRDVGAPFHSLVVRGIEQATRRAGYRYVLSHVQATPEPGEYAQIWQAHHGDGMIVVGDLAHDEELLLEMQGKCPYMVVTARGKLGTVPRVVVDNRAGITALLDHLYSLGHRRIGFAYTSEYWDMRERCAAFMSWMHAHGLDGEDAPIAEAPLTFEGGVQALGALLARPHPPTAVLCNNDVMAIGALKAALARGLAVPGDLSIAGFDDIEFAAYTTPGLTTVRQPIFQIGETAATLLIEWLEDGRQPEDTVILPVELVIRESTGAPRG